MRNQEGFTLWADDYEASVRRYEEENRYPFAGYGRVLGTIYRTIRAGNGGNILDIGFGTGALTKKLYDDGCRITGIDFSSGMIKIAEQKMPGARLILHDFSRGLPACLADQRFDFIVCTYAIHHLDDPGKVALLRELYGHLAPGGKILLGDVAFQTDADLEACRAQSGSDWDASEAYPVAERLARDFPRMRFEKISFCAGVLTFPQEGGDGR